MKHLLFKTQKLLLKHFKVWKILGGKWQLKQRHYLAWFKLHDL